MEENQKINNKEFRETYKQATIKHPWFKEGIMNGIRKYFKINEHKTTYRNYWDIANPCLQRSPAPSEGSAGPRPPDSAACWAGTRDSGKGTGCAGRLGHDTG